MASKLSFLLNSQLSRAKKQISGPVYQGLEKPIHQMISLVDSAQAELDVINESQLLTAQGKVQEIKLIGQKLLEQLQPIFASGNGYKRNLSAMQKQLRPTTGSSQDQLVQLLTHQEIRQQLRNEDQLSLVNIYRKAINSGDNLLAEAMELAPIPLLEKNEIAKGQQTRFTKSNPETAARITEITIAADLHERAVAEVKKAVTSLTGVSPDLDQVKDVAVGGRK